MLTRASFVVPDQMLETDYLGAGGTIYPRPIGPPAPKTMPASAWSTDEYTVTAPKVTAPAPVKPKGNAFMDWLNKFTDSGFRYMSQRDAMKAQERAQVRGLQTQVAQMPDGSWAVGEAKSMWSSPGVLIGLGLAAVGVVMLMSSAKKNPPRRRRRR